MVTSFLLAFGVTKMLQRMGPFLARNCVDRERSTRRLCGVKQPRIPLVGAAEIEPSRS
jgi:hypothetical protein